MEEEFRKHKLSLAISIILVCTLTLALPPPTTAWSYGGYSADPSDPDYGTHDWIAQHALDWLPDNGAAPDGIGDFFNQHPDSLRHESFSVIESASFTALSASSHAGTVSSRLPSSTCHLFDKDPHLLRNTSLLNTVS